MGGVTALAPEAGPPVGRPSPGRFEVGYVTEDGAAVRWYWPRRRRCRSSISCRCGGAVRLDHVSFTSAGGPSPAVDDVTADIAPGQLVALVGPSGAGKTTITGLIARFHDPQHGRILIDGTDVRQVTRSSLTAQLGMVFQDTFLFHASIAGNLRYARPDA